MKLSKRLLHHPRTRALLARLAALYIRFVVRGKDMDVDVETLNRAAREHGGAIVAFWHARLMMMSFAWQDDPARFRMMISDHRDGLLISQIIAHFGIPTQSINAKSGGLRALRSMKRHLDEGASVGITPDGPRGPRREVKPGVIALARMSGRPILPLSYSASRRKVFDSWDRFTLVLPSGRLVLRAGEPLLVPRDAGEAEMERLRQELEDRLNALDALVDEACGHAPDPYRAPRPQPAAAPVAIEDDRSGGAA